MFFNPQSALLKNISKNIDFINCANSEQYAITSQNCTYFFADFSSLYSLPLFFSSSCWSSQWAKTWKKVHFGRITSKQASKTKINVFFEKFSSLQVPFRGPYTRKFFQKSRVSCQNELFSKFWLIVIVLEFSSK